MFGGGDFGLLDDVHDGGGGFGTGFLGHGVDQLLLGLFGTHAGDMLKLGDALFIDFLHFGLTFLQGLDLVVEVLAHAFQFVAFLLQLVDLLAEVLLALFKFVLGIAEFVVLLIDALLVLAFHLQILLFGLEDFVFLDDFAFLFSVLEDLLALGEQLVAQHRGGQPYAYGTAGQHSDYNKYCGHNVCLVFVVGTAVVSIR